MNSWAKIKGAFVLSRKNIARIIAAISAALFVFHTSPAAREVRAANRPCLGHDRS